ncbi:uncharacterized protein V6R79_021988 [Siganus canaliculatus]
MQPVQPECESGLEPRLHFKTANLPLCTGLDLPQRRPSTIHDGTNCVYKELEAMSHINPGLISAYNSLTDKHLAGYFSNTRIRRHLHRAGLITRSGRIVPDKEYRHKLIQRAQHRHVRECLAQAIFHKVLEMERVHQTEIRRKLEEFARRERLNKIKAERSKRYEEDTVCIMSPRPPMGARDVRKQHSGLEGDHTESSESPGSSRPNTAPGKMQRPVRLKPIHSNSTTASLRRSSPYRLLESCNDNEQRFSSSMEKESRRRLTRMEASRDISPYCLPVINNFVTPVPPATKRKERGVKVTPSCTLRGRRLRPTTASSGPDVNEDPPWLRSSVHQSKVSMTMMYFGKSVHLSRDLTDMRDEVKVFQQHCGGENLCVYKGLLREGETFRFVSRRHRGFPFSLTFFLNGLQVERLSSCCEFKHRKGSRLGGRHGHFGFTSVEGASPCYKCIIAVGLDKKPTPPPKRVKGDGGREGSSVSPKFAPELKTERMTEDTASPSECETNQNVESPVREDTAAEEDKVRDEYEEDFEADDEGPAEEEKEKRALSPSSEAQSQTKDASGGETEDDEKDDVKSSSSASDREESDGEVEKEDKKAEEPKEVSGEEEAVPPPDETGEADPEEAAVAEAEPAPESDLQNSAAESTEIDVSDTTVPSENDNKQSEDTSGDKEAEQTVDESKPEEEEERAKSVQEEMAEATLQESHCSAEPELSDTSAEEKEEPTAKGHEQHTKDPGPESSVPPAEQQQTFTEEKKSEDGAAAEAAEAMAQGPDPEQKEEPEQESHQNSDGTKEEEEAAEEKAGKEDKSEDADVLLASGEVSDDKTSEPREDLADKSNHAEENQEQPAAVADVQQEETGRGAKSDEENESEPNKKTDETGVADNVEAEATTGGETMEMKAEPSEEQEEALNCEEAPVGETERSQRGRSPDREAEVTAETSGSSVERSGDAAGEETAGTSETTPKDESNGDGLKEEVKAEEEGAEEEGAEEVGAAEEGAEEVAAETDEQERCDTGEEQTEKPEETCDEVEEKPEEKSKTSSDEIAGGEESEGGHVDDEDKTETDGKREESAAAESTKEDTEGNAEKEAEETQGEKEEEEEEETAGENVSEVEKMEKDEESECMEKNEEEQGEEGKGAATSHDDEKVSDGEKDDEAEKQEEDQTEEPEAEQSEAVEDEEETKEEKVTTSETLEGEETSETDVKPDSNVQADSDRENVNISDGNEDVCSSGEAKMAPETGTTLNKTEAEDETREAEGGSKNAENGEVDAENGEFSSAAEKNAHRDEASSESEEEGTSEQNQDEMKTEEPKEDVEEVTAEAGDRAAEKHEVDQAQSEGQEGGSSVEKQDESAEMTSDPETPGGEVTEESQEARKQDENGNISEQDRIKMDDHVQTAPSGDGEESSAPAAVDLEDSSHNVEELNANPESDYKTEQTPQTNESVTADEHPATDGENGDTEEASKASEEGASVLLKPQEQSSPLPQNNEAEAAEVRKETPETLEQENNADLVKNWVTTHQKSKFFETFVEPLEDLKESDAQDEEATELQRPESPLKSVEGEQGQRSNANETNDEVEEAAEELKGNHPEDGVVPEKDPVTDSQPAAQTEVKDFISEAANEQNENESVNVPDVRSEEERPLEKDQEQEGGVQDDAEQIDKTEVESFAGTHLSVTSGRAESATGKETEEQNAEKQSVVEEAKEEELPEPSTNPEGLSEYETKNAEDGHRKSPEVTQITDLTEFRIQEETNDPEPKASDEGVSGETGDTQLIQDLQHTASKDRLGSFSVDETWFGPSPYPSTTTARTESGH